MKSDLSLGDLKKRKKLEKFYKKSSQIDFEFLLNIEAPYETTTSVFLSPLDY